MFYDLFPVDARSQHNSSGERQLQRGFDIVTSVETVPSGSIKKFTSTGKVGDYGDFTFILGLLAPMIAHTCSRGGAAYPVFC